MKDIKKTALMLLVIFILVGLAYEPLKRANFNAGGNVNTPSSIGTSDGNLVNSSNKSVAENIKNTEQDIKRLEENLNKKVGESVRSPYYGKIRMSGVSGLYQNDPGREYIYLSTGLEKNEAIKITGWFLKSEVTGYFAVISKAALLPFPFTQTESDVVLGQGDRAYLTKGFSPVGVSFRTNKCTGYFAENRTFTPGLPLECPLPKDEKLPDFSNVYDRNDECLNIIDRIWRCTTVDSVFVRNLPDTVPESCKTYITTQINYNTCLALHFSDTDFPGNEYRLYLNKFGPLWRQRQDKINLYDENNLIVDTISY